MQSRIPTGISPTTRQMPTRPLSLPLQDQVASFSSVKQNQGDTIHFSGLKKQSPQKRWYETPTTKIVSGSALLLSGISIKLLGIATIIGAPILVPIGFIMAASGLGIAVWGGLQAYQGNKEQISSNSASKCDINSATSTEMTLNVN